MYKIKIFVKKFIIFVVVVVICYFYGLCFR